MKITRIVLFILAFCFSTVAISQEIKSKLGITFTLPDHYEQLTIPRLDKLINDQTNVGLAADAEIYKKMVLKGDEIFLNKKNHYPLLLRVQDDSGSILMTVNSERICEQDTVKQTSVIHCEVISKGDLQSVVTELRSTREGKVDISMTMYANKKDTKKLYMFTSLIVTADERQFFKEVAHSIVFN